MRARLSARLPSLRGGETGTVIEPVRRCPDRTMPSHSAKTCLPAEPAPLSFLLMRDPGAAATAPPAVCRQQPADQPRQIDGHTAIACRRAHRPILGDSTTHTSAKAAYLTLDTTPLFQTCRYVTARIGPADAAPAGSRSGVKFRAKIRGSGRSRSGSRGSGGDRPGSAAPSCRSIADCSRSTGLSESRIVQVSHEVARALRSGT